MFRRKKSKARHAAELRAAIADQKRTERAIESIQAQDEEVIERTARLQERQTRNHFAASMYAAMGAFRGNQ